MRGTGTIAHGESIPVARYALQLSAFIVVCSILVENEPLEGLELQAAVWLRESFALIRTFYLYLICSMQHIHGINSWAHKH